MKNHALVICLSAIAACTTPAAESPDREDPATSSIASELGNACTIQCRNANLQCNATCERFPRPNCEENCDARFLNCMRACGCPFSNEFDRVVFDHAEATNTYICVGSWPNPGLVYQKYNTFQRTEHVRETLECDGTPTQTVLWSTVSPSGACYHKLFPDTRCSLATVSPLGLCIF